MCIIRIVLIIIIGIHGIIHFFGFAKAFGFSDLKELTQEISKPQGITWLIVGLLFIITLILYLVKSDFWWLIAIISVVLSQLVIIFFWKDAKFGTIANIIILFFAIIAMMAWSFENSFNSDVRKAIAKSEKIKTDILGESDISHLPALVQNYIRYTGALNKPKVKNMKLRFDAEMRNEDQVWFKLTTEQYNFFDDPERLFFLKARFKGFPTEGYHHFNKDKAYIKIKLLSMIPVVDISGKDLQNAETVTFFNDMCVFAPATLIDKRIRWKEIDSTSVEATFSTKNKTIKAILHFNDKGELVNFESDDRYDVKRKKQFKFSTPLRDYQWINGHRIASYGEAVWHYPEGEFVYGRFKLKNLHYNITEHE